MLSADAQSPYSSLDQSRIRVVLVRARNPNNIGAVARAMHDFGFGRLYLVGEYATPFESARSAVDASEVLASAVAVPALAEALTGCALVVGTTAVGERVVHHPLLGLAEAGPRIQSHAASGDVALLFGSEKTGLSNEDLSFCDLLLTVPMHQHEGIRHPSMNLGQAVAVCLWELVRIAKPVEPAQESRAAAEEVERVFARLLEVMATSEYTRRHPATADPAGIRRLVHRMALSASDVPVWLGVFRQILWKLGAHTGREQP